jgi:hypothetical protein
VRDRALEEAQKLARAEHREATIRTLVNRGLQQIDAVLRDEATR